MIIPHRESMRNGYAMELVTGLSTIVTRSMP